MTVWYDYTISLRAVSRNGIAATEWRLGGALAEIEPGTRCFALGPGSRLLALDPDRDLPKAVYADANAGLAPAPQPRTWRSDVRAALTSALGPAAIPLIQRISRARLATARAKARVRMIGRRPGPKAPALSTLVGLGDVVVTMGADWGGDVLDAIRELKHATGCSVVVMVYDLIPLTHTHLAFHNDRDLFERYYRRVLDTADVVTCISEATRVDLLEFCAARQLPVPRAEVLHLGDGDHAVEIVSDADRQPFFLWVGTLERRKNFGLLYDALRILESEGAELPTIVIAGARGWGVGDLLDEIELQTTRASRSLVFLGGVPDRTLDALYARAEALLFPSHYEGWGLPLREAAIRGCPVAAGDTAASREALAGFAGATLLPTDDPGPWADFLARRRSAATPLPQRRWTDSAQRLREIVTDLGATAS